MAASLSGVFSLQEFTDAGGLMVAGRVYTFVSGTTTQKTAYTDAAGTVPHTYTSDGQGGQYIALNARGELPAPLFLASGAYDICLKRVDGTTVWTRYAVGASDASSSVLATFNAFVAQLLSSVGASIVGFIQAGTGAVARTVQSKLRESVSVMDFGAKGDGVTDDSPAFTAALAWARDNGKLITVPWTPTYYNLATTVSFPGHTANAVNATSINYGVRLLGLGGGGLSSRPKIQGNIAGFLFNLGGSDLAHVTYSDTLENLYLGNLSTSANTGCVKLGYVWDCTLKDCRFGSAGVNVDLGAWTMSSRFDNVRQDGTGSVAGTATTVAYGSLNGGLFTGAWAISMYGGSIFGCQYGFRGYGDITQSGRMDIEHVNVVFNFIAEGPYVFDAHIEDFDCLFTNDSSVYPSGFATAGGSAGSGECMFTYRGSFSNWRGATSPIVIRPLTVGRQFINLDDTYNKGGPYTVHNMSGAWNAVTDMTFGGGQSCVVSLKRTSPLPDFATTGWKPNYGATRTAKYIIINADRAETSGQFRLEGWTNRLQTEQVVKANFTPNATINQLITNGSSYSLTVTATGARPGDFVRVAFLNNAGTGGLPNGVLAFGTCTANDVVVINFLNASGGSLTVFGTTYAFVDPHDSTTVD